MESSGEEQKLTYYQRNKAKVLAYQKEYNKKNAAKYKQYQHNYYLKHQEDKAADTAWRRVAKKTIVELMTPDSAENTTKN